MMTPLKVCRPGARWFAILIIAGIGMVGCSKSERGVELKPQTDEGLSAEAISVRKAFETASPSYRNPVGEMLNLVQAGQANPGVYAEVLPQLEKLAANPTISAEQKSALETLIQKLQAERAQRNPR